MKIDHVEIFRYSLPMEPFAIATGIMDYAQNVFVRVFTNEGLIGGGECSAFPYITGETQDTCIAMARLFGAAIKGKRST